MARRFSGHRLRTLRREAGVSRTALAAAVYRCEHTVYLWERGRVAPSADALARIADTLGCRIDDLLVEEACA
ncbi:MAG TPA: helix-turn-helix transcriptional regulator [Nannocystis sp.]